MPSQEKAFQVRKDNKRVARHTWGRPVLKEKISPRFDPKVEGDDSDDGEEVPAPFELP